MPNNQYSPHSSSIGNTDANIISTLAYVLPIVISFVPIIGRFSYLIPIVMFFVEKDSNLVKFHSIQSTALYIVKTVVIGIVSLFSFIPLLGGLLLLVFSLAFLAITVFLAVRAYSYDEYKLPMVGDFVSKLIK